MQKQYENLVTKLWTVRYCQNLTACDTFNEETFKGPTSITHQIYGFITEEDAIKFFNDRKTMLKFAGCAGDYYTYPMPTAELTVNPKRNVVIGCFTDGPDGEYFDLVWPGIKEICVRCDGEGTHVNPAIDEHGISPEEFRKDPEFKQAYFEGRYDITCQMCEGEKIILSPDLGSLPINVREEYEKMQRHHDQVERESASERRWGA